MEKLLKGALFWQKSNEKSNQKYIYDNTDEEVITYTEKIKTSKSNFDETIVATYFNLRKSLKRQDYDKHDKIVIVKNNNIVFCPFEVTDVFTSQSNAFNILEEYWKANDTVNELNIDITPATTENIKNILKNVSLEEIKIGIQIWETLPCRIKKINIYEPEKNCHIVWVAKKLLPMFVNKKVFQKLNFIKCDLSVSKHGKAY